MRNRLSRELSQARGRGAGKRHGFGQIERYFFLQDADTEREENYDHKFF
jgi:hypothetical protein